MKTSTGSPLILGAEIVKNGVNFAIFSRHALSASLLFFKDSRDRVPYLEIPLDPTINKTGNVWYIFVEDAGQGDLYAWRFDGPHRINKGHRFNPEWILLDPYAKAITDIGGVPKGIVVSDEFDWQGTSKSKIPWKETVIYETHVRGLTIHRSSESRFPGAYKGAVEKIPYFKELGVTSVEFLPIHEFNHLEKPHKNPVTGEIMGNYWGYSTIGFFAPKGSYSSSGDNGGQVDEFREMVREFHKVGIEVILDVVYNHTAEMDRRGPVYNFRGIDNKSYYILQKDKRHYVNLSGCGNSFQCNGAAGRRLILDSLKYWYIIMGVDGFRFDLAAMFYRDKTGDWRSEPTIIRDIRDDPVLADAKLIAEPWDAAGGYNPGQFGDNSWHGWNDKFRDDVRKFWNGIKGSTGAFASRLAGSEDIFHAKESPLNSINYCTAHDGFTLKDLVSYRKKHNHQNGHNNRDGASENWSINFGCEGESDDPHIVSQRLIQAKNFILTLFLSQGVPMINGGDEFLRTQQGNNNNYRQNNETTWFNWNLLKNNREFIRFVKEVINFRSRHAALRRAAFFTGKTDANSKYPDIAWYDENCRIPDWNRKTNRLVCLINGDTEKCNDDDILILFNAEPRGKKFKLPSSCNGSAWRLVINTASEHPGDIVTSPEVSEIDNRQKFYTTARSTVVFLADRKRK
ncbi:MAG: glycogen-debranching protein [Candidatus Marinimicrobia bacterium]|nr:glycogen-debranching protein [Candidatus Neomarinimicrobiota bacterium]